VTTSPRKTAEVEILSAIEGPAFPEGWYEIATSDHFWMEWRLRAFLTMAETLEVERGLSLRGLDVGCGVGTFRRQLEETTSWTVDGADLIRAALEASQAKRGRNLLYDVNERRAGLAETYDLVFLFDVLEHVPDPARFLESSLFHLRPGGWLFLNVPALAALWSNYDTAAGHLRRYDRKSMRAALAADDLDVEDLRYWGLTMLPLLMARKLLLKLRPAADPDAVIRNGFRPPGAFVHGLLKTIMGAETTLVQRPPLGTSLLAAARKSRLDSR
jgi:2-polyprenyl-3-methyl-5-hydroxy-6-metoxy-1,4-benzoquinol methylase